MHEVIVIGGGLVGAAATRQLSAATHGVLLLTPGPAPAAGEGPFSSHDDDSRIVRRTTRDLQWAILTDRTLATIELLERETGIRIFHPRAGLHVAPLGKASPFLAAADGIVEALDVPCERLADNEAIRRMVPQVTLSEPCHGLLEGPPAGLLAPHALIEAQLGMARRQGASIVHDVVAGVRRRGDHVVVTMRDGSEHHGRRALIAAGAYCRDRAFMPVPLDLRVKSEITVRLTLSEADAERLASLPTVVYECVTPEIDTIYLVPPFRGSSHPRELKMGCNTFLDRWLGSGAEMNAWVAHGDAEPAAAAMVDAATKLVGLRDPVGIRTHRCLVTYTPSGWPMVDEVDEGVFVATGGNGLGAKSSDGIGGLAAVRVLEGRWRDEVIEESCFRAVVAGGETEG